MFCLERLDTLITFICYNDLKLKLNIGRYTSGCDFSLNSLEILQATSKYGVVLITFS